MDTYSSSPYQSSAAIKPADKPASFLFVGGVPLEAGPEQIKAYFSRFGRVQCVDLPASKDGKRRGFALVKFHDKNTCGLVLGFPEHLICGKSVAVRPGLDSSEAATETREMQLRKLFISNLPTDMQEEHVQKLFGSFGRVTKILIPKGGIKRRAFCYVIMEDLLVFNKLVSKGIVLYQGQKILVEPAVVVGHVRTPKRATQELEHAGHHEIETTTCSSESKTKSVKILQGQEPSPVPSKFKVSQVFTSSKREYLNVAIPQNVPEENIRFNFTRRSEQSGLASAQSSRNICNINSQQVKESKNPSRDHSAIYPQQRPNLYRPF